MDKNTEPEPLVPLKGVKFTKYDNFEIFRNGFWNKGYTGDTRAQNVQLYGPMKQFPLRIIPTVK